MRPMWIPHAVYEALPMVYIARRCASAALRVLHRRRAARAAARARRALHDRRVSSSGCGVATTARHATTTGARRRLTSPSSSSPSSTSPFGDRSFRPARSSRHAGSIRTSGDARIEQLVDADLDHVALCKLRAPDAPAAHEDAVGAVQVLDRAAVARRDDLGVMPAHELAVDLQVVVRGAPDHEPSRREQRLADHGALQREHEPADRRPHVRRGVVLPARFDIAVAPYSTHCSSPIAACSVLEADRGVVLRERREQRRIAERIDEPRDAARVAVDDRVGLRARRARGRRRRRPAAGGRRNSRCPARTAPRGGSAAARVAAAASSSGESILALSSGCPARMIRSTFSLVVSTPDSSRTSSSTLLAQVLRLVDDQQHLAAVRVLLDQERVQGRDQLGLASS